MASDSRSTLGDRLKSLWNTYGLEVLKFGTVGGAAFLVNAAVVWALMLGPFENAHTKAKVIASVVATIFAWIMNRLWTFREDRSENWKREGIEFAFVNILGILVEAGCVFFINYVLGLRSPEASFISGTIIGTALGTILRYFLYRFWVYGKHRKQVDEGDATEHEELGYILNQATGVLTGSVPVVDPAAQAQRSQQNVEITDVDKPSTGKRS